MNEDKIKLDSLLGKKYTHKTLPIAFIIKVACKPTRGDGVEKIQVGIDSGNMYFLEHGEVKK